jgi:hypothetical protein
MWFGTGPRPYPSDARDRTALRVGKRPHSGIGLSAISMIAVALTDLAPVQGALLPEIMEVG